MEGDEEIRLTRYGCVECCASKFTIATMYPGAAKA